MKIDITIYESQLTTDHSKVKRKSVRNHEHSSTEKYLSVCLYIYTDTASSFSLILCNDYSSYTNIY